MKTWNVYKDDGTPLGQVHEDNEELARCAALSKFGLNEDQMEHMTRERIASLVNHRIMDDEDFSVRQA